MEEKRVSSDYTVKRVNEDGSKQEVSKVNLPINHLDVIESQLKRQARKLEKEYLERKKKEANRKREKMAKKSRKKNRKK